MNVERLLTCALIASLFSGCARRDPPPQKAIDMTPVQRQAPADLAGEDGVLKVVTLGDSLAYGAGDESGKGIAGRIRTALQQKGFPAVEAINLGVNGAQTADLLERLNHERTTKAIAEADAVIVSIGANDLFRTPGAREATLRAPLVVAERILDRIESIVREIHDRNPHARILLLGGYNPVPSHPQAGVIDQYIGLWDGVLASRFEDNRQVSVVKMIDIVTHQRLSRYDNFHPGADAYAEAARRIADLLVEAA